MDTVTFDIFGSLVLLVSAIINVLTLVAAIQTHRVMAVLEKNTNSKMDALLAATAKSSQAKGKAEGLAQGRTEKR